MIPTETQILDENENGKVMEHEKLLKVMEFCNYSWNFETFPLNLTKCVPFLLTLRN